MVDDDSILTAGTLQQDLSDEHGVGVVRLAKGSSAGSRGTTQRASGDMCGADPWGAFSVSLTPGTTGTGATPVGGHHTAGLVRRDPYRANPG